MTATLEQLEADLDRLITLAQRGEEIVITSHGRAIAKLSGVAQPARPRNRQGWLAKLSALRARLATGKAGLTVEQILDEDRGE